MLDTRLQERFARSCTDAAFGYTAATTAACAAFTEQVLNFWTGVLVPSHEPPPSTPTWGWPAPARQEVPSLPFNPFAWAVPQRQAPAVGFPFAGASLPFNPFDPFAWTAPQRQAPAVGFPFATAGYAPFQAWLGMFPFAGPPAAWPMAFMLMASGVPRSVAWPAAEANVAVMDAADAAAVSVQQVFSSYRTDGGHAVARQAWPPAHLVMLMALLPLNFNAMMTSLRMG